VPYSKTEELPEAVKKEYTTTRCQQVFMRVFNKTIANGDSEERAFQNSHAAAKNCKSGIQ